MGWLLAAALAALLGAAPARAGLSLADFRGHLSVGYGKLAIEDAPGGSLSFAAGLDAPLGTGWRLGPEIGYSLLGSRVIENEAQTLSGELDYSVLEAALLVHWVPSRGPLGRVSAGPGIFHARADLNSSAPITFESYAVAETAPGFSLAATLMPRHDRPLRAGLEIGFKSFWLPDETWTLVTGRLAIHY